MQSNRAGFIPRSSSLIFSLPPSHNLQEPLSLNVAHELLNRPNHARQRSAFPTSSNRNYQLDGPDSQPDTTELAGEAQLEGATRRTHHTSNTWTSSSGGAHSVKDDFDDRTIFVQGYNRLARRHGVRTIVPEEHEQINETFSATTKNSSWFSRKILRRTSSSHSTKHKHKPERHLKHMRSISDSLRIRIKNDKLKDKDLHDLARLCGMSLLYLPTEYSAGSLSVPTCFRATAQFLVQHAPTTRGVFRIPGSQHAVAALYNYYCTMEEEGQLIAGTVRFPALPDHIKCDTHDVASAFKRFVAGLPGGILGSLALFNAFVSIQTQLHGDAELTKTKQSKVRARLIALAVATLGSQYRRELICAVFGLLSMIGRAAEMAPREDERGRPLPTSDLMGYGALGITFGPVLVGDLLEDYTLRIFDPHDGLVLLPISPPKSRKERSKKIKSGEEGMAFNNQVDKIKVANSITEMLITHWRDVVRHLKSLNALKIMGPHSLASNNIRFPVLRPSASETFAIRKPPDWDHYGPPLRHRDRSVSPTPGRRGTRTLPSNEHLPFAHNLVVKKQRFNQSSTTDQPSDIGPRQTSLPVVEEISRQQSGQTSSEIDENKPRSAIWNQSNNEHNTPKQDPDKLSGCESKGFTEPSIKARVDADAQDNWELNFRYTTTHDGGNEPVPNKHFAKRPNQVESNTSQASHIRILTPETVLSTSQTASQKKSKSPSTGISLSRTFNVPFASSKNVTRSAHRESAKTSREEPRTPNTDSSRKPKKLTKSVERHHSSEASTQPNNIKDKLSKLGTYEKEARKSRGTAQQSSVANTVANADIEQANIHDKFWPFDWMLGSGPSGTNNTAGPKLEVTVTRSSSKEVDDVSWRGRRLMVISDPGLQPHARIASGSRRVSRSLNDHIKPKLRMLDLQLLLVKKDPLSRVSHEEDLASLTTLSYVLDYVDTHDDSVVKQLTSSFTNDGTFKHRIHKPPAEIPSKHIMDLNSTSLPGPVHVELDCQTDGQRSRTQTDLRLKMNDSLNLKKRSTHSKDEAVSPGPAAIREKAILRSKLSADSTVRFTPRKGTGSPRSPSSKISALVAKYNNANADASPSKASLTKISFAKSPSKSNSQEPAGKGETSKEAFLSQYTTNSPSPSRSHSPIKSEKGGKQCQPRRTPESTVRLAGHGKNTSRTRIPALETNSGMLLDHSTTTRDMHNSVGVSGSPTTTTPSKIPRPKVDQIKHTHRNPGGSILDLSGQGTSKGSIDQVTNVVRTLARSTSQNLTPPPKVRISLEEVVKEIRGSSPSLLRPGVLRSVKDTTEAEPKETTEKVELPSRSATPVAQIPSDVVAHDGPAGELRIHPMLRPPRHNSPPLRTKRSSSANLPSFVHPDSPFRDTFSSPTSPASRSPPRSRRNSSPHSEIKSLQKQLYSQTEEIVYLRQQLAIWQRSDTGALVGQLTDLKQELQKWRTRAKVAEKQLETVFKAPNRSLSAQVAYDSVSRYKNSLRDPEGDGCPNKASSADSRHQTDGAASDGSDYSSTDTVVRDIPGVMSGNEYSMWVGQAADTPRSAEFV